MVSLRKSLGLQEGNFPRYKLPDCRLDKEVVVVATTVLARGPIATLRVTIILRLPLLPLTQPHWPG
jgi:hypothetical protein